MKKLMLVMFVLCSGLLCSSAQAQEHYTEAPVWEVSYYRTKQGHFEDYMKYLRANFLPQNIERKKQGLILDFKVYLNTGVNSPNDWDVAIAYLYPNYAAALDYNKSDEDRNDAITAKHYRTQSKEKQAQMAAERFKFRDHISTQLVREVTLKPMP